ncbi:MBL fold metallo-hydrolase [uncultured Paludibaculum sp.]|uniref:MBL fold metallo-hydrolase n=1 Tax=uncultured Paludibaculum sp. TaxID=1765020 RepID=UPI002AABBF15|nr:MBL fold metallo-hydrolase [uncultured Paludibaculum sp.]
MRMLLLTFAATAALMAQTHPTVEFKTKAGPLKLTAIKHASFMLEAGGQVVHVDPTSPGDYTGLPQADLILVTDIHGDHLDPKALAAVRKSSTKVVAPKAAAEKLEGTQVMANGETTKVGAWTIEAVPMYNLKRGPSEGKLFHEKGRGNGYVVTYGGFRLYISGDTEGIPEMRALKNIDAALICMNLPYTMPPDEAAEAVKGFKPKIAIPYHYRGSDLSLFEKGLAGSGVQVKLLDWYK